MGERVGRHLTAVAAFVRVFGELHPGRGVAMDGLPDYSTLKASGPGRFLRPAIQLP